MALSYSKKFDLEVVRCINYVYMILDIIFIGIMK